MSANVTADLVLAAFRALPAKAKPRVHADGVREWTPLSGIVVADKDVQSQKCVALGTGMRCLPANKLGLGNGDTLHDWHAEIVAIRAFNHFLLQQCLQLTSGSMCQSEIIRFRDRPERTTAEPQPFAIKDSVEVSMLSTEMPCGDASMELIMHAQADASPWTSQSRSELDGMLQTGRGHFAELGIVRRKPSRADAPSTLSKSCSDKLALKQCTSLLSSLASLLIHPGNAYLHELIVPQDQFIGFAVHRAFGAEGRLRPLTDDPGIWTNGYSFRPFLTVPHNHYFEFSRPPPGSIGKAKGSNITAVWTPTESEVLIGGIKQGYKQFSGAGHSSFSRRGMCRLVQQLSQTLDDGRLQSVFSNSCTYYQLKDCDSLKVRRRVKAIAQDKALVPWPKNIADDFSLQSEAKTAVQALQVSDKNIFKS